MARVSITLEDDAEKPGAFNFNACFVDGFHSDSHAHQHGLLLIKHLETLAARSDRPPTEEVITKTAEGDTMVFTPETAAAEIDGGACPDPLVISETEAANLALNERTYGNA